MGLPQTVRVKLSSEVAESISLTPVVVQELAMRDLMEHILGIAGKDEARIREILLRGTLVSGASRFRWQGWQAEAPDLTAMLASFPDPDPSLPFAAARCTRVTLRGGRQAIELAREAIGRKSLLRRTTYWDLLMEVAGAASPVYQGYSYKDRTDRFLREFSRAEADRLRAGSDAVSFSTLRDQIKYSGFVQAELYVSR
jgi:hypothetical protein